MKNSIRYEAIIISIIVILVLREILSPYSFTSLQWLITSPAHQSQNGIRNDKFLQLEPFHFGGLNNQKIALAKALLTARFLNRTLLMPVFSQVLTFRQVDSRDTITFDKIFDFDKFNSLCDGFARLGHYSNLSNKTKPFEMRKKKGNKWTRERDLDQLMRYKNDRIIDEFEVIRITGKQTFLWEDYWPVKDYAKIFDCVVLVSEIEKEVTKVTSKIKEVGLMVKNGSDFGSDFSFIAVHMRIEKDWIAHCEKWQKNSNLMNVCSSKDEIVKMVSYIITPKKRPMVIYLAIADSLLDDDSILNGWGPGLFPYDKKNLGVWDIYKKHPYIVQSAIDFEVCARASVFLGNTFSTFSGLVVLSRTYKLFKLGITSLCNTSDVGYSSYAHNVFSDAIGSPKLWMTNMSDTSLLSITSGSVDVSCECINMSN